MARERCCKCNWGKGLKGAWPYVCTLTCTIALSFHSSAKLRTLTPTACALSAQEEEVEKQIELVEAAAEVDW